MKAFALILAIFAFALPARAVDDVAAIAAAAEKGDAEAQYQLGREYHYAMGVKKDDVVALKWWQKSAGQNNALAMVMLGTSYYYGAGVAVDKEEAFKWYQKAADQNSPYGQFMLGIMYEYATTVPKNHEKALSLWKQSIGPLMQAAKKGESEAQNSLGAAYHSGWGVDKDEAESFRWYMAAATQNSPSAQMYVAFSYEKGLGVAKDAVKSVEWLAKASERGLAAAQYGLAWDYYKAQGVPQDNIKAYMWADIALVDKDQRAGSLMVAVAKHMTLAQLQEATKLAHDWLAQHVEMH